MIVLHSYSPFRLSEQVETKEALEVVRQVFPVVDKECSKKMDYDEFLRLFWGKDTIITVEQDIVPSVEMIYSLAECKELWCTYEYFVRYMDDKNPAYAVFYGLGLTKFSKEAQQIASVEKWFGKGEYYNLDCRISDLLVQNKMSPHIHGQVKHNRLVDWTGLTK